MLKTTSGKVVNAINGAADTPSQKVGLWALVVIIFSNVGSGPAAIEGVIGSGGLIIGMLGILIFPIFWGYIQALLSAELSVQYNAHNGGLPAWCARQNNKCLAFNTALWILAIESSTAALVSQATAEYLRTVVPQFEDYGPRVALSVLIILLSFLLNYVSINFSAYVLQHLIAFTMVIFAVLIGFAVSNIDAAHGKRARENPFVEYKTVDWALLVNLLIFNSAGFEAGGSIISHVHKPRKNVPFAMLIVGVSTTVIYITTLTLTYVAVDDERKDWQAGHLSVVAQKLGGRLLQGLTILACSIVNLQVYSVSLQTAAYTTAAMADQNVFPKKVGFGKCKLTFATQSDQGAPSHALIFCGLVSTAFALAPFVVNLAIESVLYSAVMLAQIGCVLNLDEKNRIFVPQRRQWRLCLLIIPILLAIGVVVVQSQLIMLVMLAVTA
jgi:amino acid transporter